VKRAGFIRWLGIAALGGCQLLLIYALNHSEAAQLRMHSPHHEAQQRKKTCDKKQLGVFDQAF
jgi:hypothetical protein